MSDYIKRDGTESGVGYVGIDEDYFVSVKEVLNITVETGALETQDRIRDLSPADVEPVRHGHWDIIEYEYFTCSECGYDFWNGCDCTAEAKGKLTNGVYPNYCPNCGARMDEKEQENE